ncbi:hypothetical protein OHA72_22340 [Dactylosporangium sp. NBC_01737]|uniref:hypothetical protein n=1 Tax=Dactylosporangium sp. NBC_01737 TaxID=2975959 RepID=UPI002E0E141E|nr:hypothetical protein OHA72_22340 [Dactylosporangium sp. NBC_01737]
MLIGVGVLLGMTRLDDADKWGSVIGGIVALVGLPMTAYGLVLARRQRTSAGGQSVTDSAIGGGVAQVRGVRGNVRIGGSAAPGAGAPGQPSAARRRPSSASPSGPDGQSVAGSWTAGPVRQIDDVGGDADIDR